MKKITRLFILFITILLLIAVTVGCNNFKRPPSKEISDQKVELFKSFNTYGFVPVKLVINKDLSGHVVYFLRNSTLSEKLNFINTALDSVNEKAYTEGDYQSGYKAVFVQEKNITQSDEDISIIVEFSNINYLKGDVSVKTVKEYLEENTDDMNNNFKDAKTNEKVSIVKIEDKENNYIVVLTGVANQIPVTVDNSLISAYYGDVISVSKGTIKTSSADYMFVFSHSELPLWLMITAAVLSFMFVSALLIKIVKDKKQKNY